MAETLADDLRSAGAAWTGTSPARDAWYPYPLDPQLRRRLLELHASYAGELADLDRILREVQSRIAGRGGVTQLADAEGDLLYCLLRETQPGTVFEISPAHGWSTNHILAALTRNASGTLHSFELAPTAPDGSPIEETVRANLHGDLDASRLEFHVGDARKLAPAVPGTIDFLFLDSAHEAWFAEWYEQELFPRTRGVCFVHDIVAPAGMVKQEAYTDGEAYALLEWLEREGVRAVSAAAFEEALGLPAVRRRLSDLSSFGILFLADPAASVPPGGTPRASIQEADLAIAQGDRETAHALITTALAAAGTTTPHLKLQIAERFRRLGQAGLARDLAREVAREHRDDPLWLYEAGRTLTLLGRTVEGGRMTWSARRMETAPPWLHASRADLGRRLWSAARGTG